MTRITTSELISKTDPDRAKENILNTVKEMVVDFIYYDRRGDEELPIGAIEIELEKGNITIDDICKHFRSALMQAVENGKTNS